MRTRALKNFELVRDVVYLHGTMSPAEIQRILKSHGKSLAESTIYAHLQTLRESNTGWISDQAKAGYLETIRHMAYDKKSRLVELAQDMDACTVPRTKAYIAQVINETEDGLRDLMEGLPLLMQFSTHMNNEEKDTIVISN